MSKAKNKTRKRETMNNKMMRMGMALKIKAISIQKKMKVVMKIRNMSSFINSVS